MNDMDEKLRILLCEDDENLGMLLREYLQAKGYSAELYPDGEAGFKAFLKNKYDLCVFDVMMPKKDGFTLAQEVRAANAEIPIIFLTAKTLKEDILEGFKIGADDYITKPFGTSELLARVRTALRHSSIGKVGETEVFQSEFHMGALTVDFKKKRVLINGEDVHLTQNEYKIVSLLATNAGKILTYDFLIKNIWGPNMKNDNQILRVNMANIRRKIEKDTANPIYIITEIGIGYRMNTD